MSESYLFEEGDDNAALAFRCSYAHIQFSGRRIAPEFTHSKNGFIQRLKRGIDKEDLEKEFKLVYDNNQ